MISIVIPVYNGALYVKETLMQFKKQTTQNYELIVVDDASTDGSDTLILEISKFEDLPLYYYRLPQHMGASAARNYGAHHARGELICFLDSDDILSINYLSVFAVEYERTPYDFCFCNYNILDFRDGNNKLYSIQNYIPIKNKWRLYVNYLFGKTKICHCATVFRREFLIKNGLHYEVGCHCAEDTEFICKALFLAKNITSINKELYTYCQHTSSLSHAKPDERFFDAYTAMIRTKRALPRRWQLLFALTKGARIHGFILDQFLKDNIHVPYQYCEKKEMVFGLILSIVLAYDSHKHRRVLFALLTKKLVFLQST